MPLLEKKKNRKTTNSISLTTIQICPRSREYVDVVNTSNRRAEKISERSKKSQRRPLFNVLADSANQCRLCYILVSDASKDLFEYSMDQIHYIYHYFFTGKTFHGYRSSVLFTEGIAVGQMRPSNYHYNTFSKQFDDVIFCSLSVLSFGYEYQLTIAVFFTYKYFRLFSLFCVLPLSFEAHIYIHLMQLPINLTTDLLIN